jgi:hypothetical protein
MTTFNITSAARAAGVGRASVWRAIKSGRLSATTNERGERVIDLAELLRVFGPLKSDGQPETLASAQDEQAETLSSGAGAVPAVMLIETLREQLDDARGREQALIAERDRLLTMLEGEQAARRELEIKLLPAPAPKLTPPSHRRAWLLLILLVAALAFAGWRWRDAIRATVAALMN